jgi:acetyl esterase/lipase
MGDSGGGGVAAGTTIVARERQVALAQQILIYPMLDDRNLVPNTLL